MKKIILVFFICFLSGCAGKNDLGGQMICQGLSIDRIDKNTIEIAYQVLNPSEATATAFESEPVITYRFPLKNGEDGDFESTLVLPEKLMLSHVVAIIVGEEMAKKEMANVLDKFIRLNEIQAGVKLYIAKGVKAYELLDMLTATMKIPAQKINSLVEAGMESSSVAISRTPFQAASQMEEKGVELTLQAITVKKDKNEEVEESKKSDTLVPHSQIVISGVAVFKADKLVGYLSPEDTVFYNVLTGKANTFRLQDKCTGNEKGMNQYVLKGVKTKVTSKIQDGRIRFDVHVKGNASLSYNSCKMSFAPKDIKKLEKKLSDALTTQLNHTIAVIQSEYKTDILGYGEVLRRDDKKAWGAYKDNWNKEFEKVDIYVDSKITLTGVGKVKKTISSQKIGERQ
ncbi:MAG: Ger(x)C family spore germination protein [Bacillaceae bacterium]